MKYNYPQIYQDIKNLGLLSTSQKYHLSRSRLLSIRMYGDVFTKSCRTQISNSLKSFTPRELMEELSSRGYSGTLEYTQKININDF